MAIPWIASAFYDEYPYYFVHFCVCVWPVVFLAGIVNVTWFIGEGRLVFTILSLFFYIISVIHPFNILCTVLWKCARRFEESPLQY